MANRHLDITTHCNKTSMVNNSRNSRAARWLRNKWFMVPAAHAVSLTGNFE